MPMAVMRWQASGILHARARENNPHKNIDILYRLVCA
jgi:hypothetical protein